MFKKWFFIVVVAAVLLTAAFGCSKNPALDMSDTPRKAQEMTENQALPEEPTEPVNNSKGQNNNEAAAGQKELPAQEKDLAVTSKDQSPPAPPVNKEKKIALADLPSPAVVHGGMEAVYFTRGKPVISVGSEPFALHFVDIGNKYDREIDVQIFLYGIESPDRLDPKVECVIWTGKVKPGELIHLPPLVFPKESEDLLKACGVFGTPFFMARVNGYVSEYVAELARSIKQLDDGSYEIDYVSKKVIRKVR